MIDNESHYYTYRSGNMMVLAIMFLLFFSIGMAALILLMTGVVSGNTSILFLVGVFTLLTGIASWNMEVGIEMHPEGLYFSHLLKPGHFVSYTRVQRVSIRMLRGWYYCFMRYGDGLFSGTFFPVGYWMRDGKEETNTFLTELATRANLVQAGKTPLGAPIYIKRTEERKFE